MTQDESKTQEMATTPGMNDIKWYCHKIEDESGKLYVLDTHTKIGVLNACALAIFYESVNTNTPATEHGKATPVTMITPTIGVSIELDNQATPPENSLYAYRFIIKDVQSGYVYFNQVLNAVHIDFNGDWLKTVSFNMIEDIYGACDTVKFVWGWKYIVQDAQSIEDLFKGGI